MILGYNNFSDLIYTTLGLKTFTLNVVVAFLASLSTFITDYVYDDARAIYVMLALLIFDFATGIWYAIKSNTFTSTRLPRILVNAVVYTLLLGISWNIAEVYPLFGFLPGLIYGGLIATMLVSLLENLTKLNLIPDSILKRLLEKLGSMANKKINK